MTVTLIDFLNQLSDQGLLLKLCRAGIAPIKMITYRDIYISYRKEIAGGLKSTDAVLTVSVKMKVSESLIWKAINEMKKTV